MITCNELKLAGIAAAVEKNQDAGDVVQQQHVSKQSHWCNGFQDAA